MARRDDEHPPYWQCREADCPRFPCKVFKEGFRAGYDQGHADGQVAGYCEGFAAGLAAAARAGSG